MYEAVVASRVTSTAVQKGAEAIQRLVNAVILPGSIPAAAAKDAVRLAIILSHQGFGAIIVISRLQRSA